MNLPRFALERRPLILVALTLALFWSVASALTLERREDPGTTQRATEIITLWPGATAQNVDQLVTRKIADDLRGVAHVDHVTGTSRPGLSDINVEFDDGMRSAETPLNDIRHHLDDLRAALPADAQGPKLQEDFWNTYPVVLGVTAPGYDDRQLRDLAKSFKDDLNQLPDVGEVLMVGEQEQEVQVSVDLQRLTQYRIGVGELVAALQARNALVPAGTVALGGRQARIEAGGDLRTSDDVGDVDVSRMGGRVVRVRDLAEVGTGYPEPPAEVVHVNGQLGVALSIKAKEGSSATALLPEVQGLIDRESRSWPSAVHVAWIANQPSTINARLRDFFGNLVVGVFLVAFLVSLFMGLRNGLLVATTVVLSLTLTFGVMPLLHIDLNQISVIALIISLGMIVDAGIVAVDNIERHLHKGDDRFNAAWRGVGDLWFPLLTSTLVAISSYIPFLLMGGSIGDFVHDLGVVTPIALIMSLAVAYFITPLLGARFAVVAGAGGDGVMHRVASWFERLTERLSAAYRKAASAALRRPALTAGVAFALVCTAVVAIPLLGIQFFPPADRAQFFVDVTAPDGTDIRTTEQITRHVENIVARRGGITAYAAFIGHGAPKFYYNVIPAPGLPNYAQILVDTKDPATANALVASLQQQLRDAIAGARLEVKKIEQGPPVGTPIQVRLTGDDPNSLARASTAVQALLRSIPGTALIRDSAGDPTTRIAANIDQQRAAFSGVDDESVRNLLALAYGGLPVTSIREEDRQTPVVVRLPAALRADTSMLAGIGVRNASGQVVPLAEIAFLQPTTEKSVLTVRDGTRVVTVYANVEGRLASAVIADLRPALRGTVLPAGVSWSFAGQDEQTTKAFRNLFIAMMIGLLINQMILVWEFGAIRLSLVVLAAVPLGLVGAIAGLALTRSPFGFVAALGVASLGGIVTNHAIVLFEYARRELAEGLSLDDALIAAGTKRLRPIMLTVITSIAGLLPLGLSGSGLWPPMVWAIAFGLLGSMAMTLVAMPAIYRLAYRGNANQSQLGNLSRERAAAVA